MKTILLTFVFLVLSFSTFAQEYSCGCIEETYMPVSVRNSGTARIVTFAIYNDGVKVPFTIAEVYINFGDAVTFALYNNHILDKGKSMPESSVTVRAFITRGRSSTEVEGLPFIRQALDLSNIWD